MLGNSRLFILLLFIGYSILDAVTTQIALGEGIAEVNPFGRNIIGQYGILGMYGMKLIVVLLVGFIVYVKPYTLNVLRVLNVGMFLAVLNNLVQIRLG